MPQDLNKGFDSEKIEDILNSKVETGPSPENQDLSKEDLFESESFDFEKTGEDSKPLEKTGEKLSIKLPVRKNLKINSPEEERKKEIDKILADGLNEVFLKMSPIQQKKFKEEGDETVKKINKLLEGTKIKISKIINLIRAWLKLIPGVNKYFLEQEAKIKADRIVQLKK